jgi:Icc-related predicted phosphoesterase
LRLVAISDLHGYLPEIPACDVLLIGGDVCPVWDHNIATQQMWLRTDFTDWLNAIDAQHVVGIAGNHDFILEKYADFGYSLPWNYLHDESVTLHVYDHGTVKIHGTPWTPRFGGWALMRPDAMLAEKWDLIPDDVDIVLSHGPMYGYADLVRGYSMTKRGWSQSERVGSKTLRHRIDQDLPNLKLFVCGHIHEGYGVHPVNDNLTVYNVSHMNDVYEPVNEPTVIEWTPVR